MDSESNRLVILPSKKFSTLTNLLKLRIYLEDPSFNQFAVSHWFGRRLIHWIISSEKVIFFEEYVRFLYERGLNCLLPKDNDGKTGLHYAVSSTKISFLRTLTCENSVFGLSLHNINATDKYGKTALLYAVQMDKSTEYIRLLLNAGATVSTDIISKSIFNNNLKLFKILLRYLYRNDKQMLFRDKDGNTVLHLAMRYDKHRIVSFLIGNGFNISIRNNDGNVAFVVHGSSLRLKEIFIAKLFERDRDTALSYTREYIRSIDVSRYSTILHWTCQNNLFWLSSYVIENNIVEYTSLDFNGRTPFSYVEDPKYRRNLFLFTEYLRTNSIKHVVECIRISQLAKDCFHTFMKDISKNAQRLAVFTPRGQTRILDSNNYSHTFMRIVLLRDLFDIILSYLYI